MKGLKINTKIIFILVYYIPGILYYISEGILYYFTYISIIY